MSTTAMLAVTGSTGHLGALVARGLSEAGLTTRLLVRSPERAPRLPGATPILSDYSADRATEGSLAGVRTLFMVSASESQERVAQHLAFVDAAARAGVEHVVYTSFYGAAPEATFTLARDHWRTEQAIRGSGMGFTFLRDNLYLDFLPDMVGADGVIRGPAADGRVAAVTRADIARAAVAVLCDPAAHAGATYELTGPEALTMTQIAEILGAHAGRQVRFHAETIEEAYASRKAWHAPEWQNDAWVSTYTAIAAGELEPVTDAVPRLTGREATGLVEFLSSPD